MGGRQGRKGRAWEGNRKESGRHGGGMRVLARQGLVATRDGEDISHPGCDASKTCIRRLKHWCVGFHIGLVNEETDGLEHKQFPRAYGNDMPMDDDELEYWRSHLPEPP